MKEWLNYKGSIFDSENAIASLYIDTSNQTIKDKINMLAGAKRHLAKLYQTLPKPKELARWKKRIKETRKRIDDLTRELVKKAEIFKEQQGLKSISHKDIARYLKKDELYIDYARAGEYYYLFTVDKQAHVSFEQIDANSSREIDGLISAFRKDIEAILDDKNPTKHKLADLTQASRNKLSRLYALLIATPLADKINDKTSLVFSPDGALKLLPFEALHNPSKGTYFIQEKNIRYIPSGKEFVRLYKYHRDHHHAQRAKRSVVIFDNPDFDTTDSVVANNTQDEAFPVTPNTSRAGIVKSLFRMRFDPLPGTRIEAQNIQSTLEQNAYIQEFKENEATEANLLNIKQPNILHIATHGFFINDNTIPNPMLKSGIALSGANTSAIQGKSDGIVTALKLSGLKLKGTDLVVLSACKTGVVDINSTDSVSGLSKAFIQAGASDIVMSLWSVNDQATQKLMSRFYKQMHAQPDYAAALKSAKLQMIDQGLHPFYWAGFVVNGL
jgi:CHAT domain-containing protein